MATITPKRVLKAAGAVAALLACASPAYASGPVLHTRKGFIEKSAGVAWLIPFDGSKPRAWDASGPGHRNFDEIAYAAKYRRLVAAGERTYGGGILATSEDGSEWHPVKHIHTTGRYAKLASMLLAKSRVTTFFATDANIFYLLPVPSYDTQSMNATLRRNAGKVLVCRSTSSLARWACDSFVPKVGGQKYPKASSTSAYACGDTLTAHVTDFRATPEGTVRVSWLARTKTGKTWHLSKDPVPPTTWHCVGGKLFTAIKASDVGRGGRYVYVLTHTAVVRIAHLDITGGYASNDITGNRQTLIVYGQRISTNPWKVSNVAEVSHDGGHHYTAHDLNIPPPASVTFAGGMYATQLSEGPFMESKDGVAWRKP